MEDYLKSIFRLEERHQRVTTQALAERLAVAPASVTSMVKRLAERGLLTHERYRGVGLTEAGRRVAQEMIRHHRLLELYLTQALGFDQDQVHAEAERLEHFISEQFEERIDQILGRPTCDPHGSPIPSRPGQAPAAPHMALTATELFLPLSVLQSPPELQEIGIKPGVVAVMLGKPQGAKVHLRVGEREHLIDPALCQQVIVQRALPAIRE
ncbi:metal-dependent transcriptional regulator [bacterium]|nr:metal-dependent transcriptional regulator [bacterium]